jgi:hypothetical protein
MVEPEPLSENDWQYMAGKIRASECVLLLGPDIAVDPADEKHTPLTTKLSRLLAEKLTERLGRKNPIGNRDDLAHVAQIFNDAGQILPQFGRFQLETEVKKFYGQYDGATTSLHRELAELPFDFVVNTTPDHFMLNAFKGIGKRPTAEYYDPRPPHNVQIPDIGQPLIFDLYGSRQNPSSLILTENDLLIFLINVIRNEPALPTPITAKFADKDTTFLFVGFGFQRWHVRILLHALGAHEHSTRSFALENPEFFKLHDQAMAFFQKYIGFKLFSWEQFTAELKRHHRDMTNNGTGVKPIGPDTGPLVFLSYFHNDEQIVSGVQGHLENRGMRVWRDRQDLRAGDKWDERIRAVIDRCDYVVVFESRYASTRVESNVYREMRHALERQNGIAYGVRFVIPVRVDDCPGFKELADLHTGIDLTNPNGVAALASAIEEDWALRPGRAGVPTTADMPGDTHDT